MMPADDPFLTDLVGHLAGVPGIAAIVLGGSRATGTAVERSDYDIGLYIEPDKSLDVAALDAVASSLDDRQLAGLVTPRGGWGPWIDGGGWLDVKGRRVDLLYRDLGKVREVIAEAHEGRFSTHYQPGHPHGFLSTIYMGEVAICRPLSDPKGIIGELKAQTAPYPAPLRESLVAFFLWEAGFSLENGRKSLVRHDAAYAAGCGFRSVACLMQVLFAVNGVYCINEKGAVARAGLLPLRPERLSEQVDAVFSRIGLGESAGAFDVLERLIDEVRELTRTSR